MPGNQYKDLLSYVRSIFHPLNIKHASHQIKNIPRVQFFLFSRSRFICRNLLLFIVCNNGRKFINDTAEYFNNQSKCDGNYFFFEKDMNLIKIEFYIDVSIYLKFK
jgi:hypothetical protein